MRWKSINNTAEIFLKDKAYTINRRKNSGTKNASKKHEQIISSNKAAVYVVILISCTGYIMREKNKYIKEEN